MAIRYVYSLGFPGLRQKAEAVPAERIRDAQFQRFLDDLVETMFYLDGVGLAAPQVGEPLRVFTALLDFAAPKEGGEAAPPVIAINPELTFHPGPLAEALEGCLSLKELRGVVPRHEALTLRARDRHGKPFTRELTGFPARVAQHEYDHLDGIVFVDRMASMKTLGFLTEMERNAEL